MRSIRRGIRSIGNPFRSVSSNGNRHRRPKKEWLCFVSCRCQYEDSSDSEAEVSDWAPSPMPDRRASLAPLTPLHASPPPPPAVHPQSNSDSDSDSDSVYVRPHSPPPPPFLLLPRAPPPQILVRSPDSGNEYLPSPSPRESRARVIEEMDENENEWPVRGPSPASDTVINSIPIMKISDAYKFDCSVCQEEFKVGEEAKQLPCSHIYHPHCIISWLSRRNSCPVCRRKLPESQIAINTDIEDSGHESTREELDEYQLHSPLRPPPPALPASAWEYFS